LRGARRLHDRCPNPRSFDPASRQISEDTIAEVVPCGPDIDQHVPAARKFTDAGFTHLAFVQVGADLQDQFISRAEHELLPALRKHG